jgi:hypothetical protein
LHYRQPDPERVQRIVALVEEIEDALDSGQDTSLLFAKLAQDTGHQLTAEEIQSYPGAIDLETFARQLACRPPRRIPDIQRDELVSIVQHIHDAVAGDEAELLYYMELFDAQVTLPSASSLVFHPPQGSRIPPSSWNPTAAEVVEIALRHKPIAL